MAQKGVTLNQETLSCPICLDLLKDPVTTSCGHNYCMNCINIHWNGEVVKRVYSCPQCRKAFNIRPVLQKNTMLANLVEELKGNEPQAAPADHCYAGPEDVACDVCTGRKRKARNSCLQCLASYCKEHLQLHYQVPPLKKHKLVEPSKKLQENVCSLHDEVMKMFCRTDHQLICHLCSMGQHKEHDTVSAAAEMAERQKELEVKILQRIQDREKDVELLQQELEAINVSADKAVEHSEKMFTELIRLMEKRRSDVKQQVRSQQETEVSGVKELQEKLEQEITELKRKDAELQKLSHTQDHNQFLQDYPSLSALSPSTHSSSINIRPITHFQDVTAAVTEITDKLQDVLRGEWTNFSQKQAEVDVLPSQSEPGQEPKTRAEFLKYSCDITLDPNTVNSFLVLSKENKKVAIMKQPQSYPSHPDRFTECHQVLSKDSLPERCYWEVERGGRGGVTLAVSYKNISRGGAFAESGFGCSEKCWTFDCANNYYFGHNGVSSCVSAPRFYRVGMYLDHRAGVLCCYGVSNGDMTLLHRVQTTFTQPLYAGLKIGSGSAELIKPH